MHPLYCIQARYWWRGDSNQRARAAPLPQRLRPNSTIQLPAHLVQRSSALGATRVFKSPVPILPDGTVFLTDDRQMARFRSGIGRLQATANLPNQQFHLKMWRCKTEQY